MNKIRGKGKVNEADVKEMMREVRLALLEADVNFKVVKQFIKTVSERAVGADVMKKPNTRPTSYQNRSRRTNKLNGRRRKQNRNSGPPTNRDYDGRFTRGW